MFIRSVDPTLCAKLYTGLRLLPLFWACVCPTHEPTLRNPVSSVMKGVLRRKVARAPKIGESSHLVTDPRERCGAVLPSGIFGWVSDPSVSTWFRVRVIAWDSCVSHLRPAARRRDQRQALIAAICGTAPLHLAALLFSVRVHGERREHPRSAYPLTHERSRAHACAHATP